MVRMRSISVRRAVRHASVPLGATSVGQLLSGGEPGRVGWDRFVLRCGWSARSRTPRHGARRVTESDVPAIQHPDQRLTHVVQQVPAIRNLHRTRGTRDSALRITARPIARDDLDAWAD
jgi:hypothetical protein